jgi:hypothetical protein
VLVTFGAHPAQALSGTVLFLLCTHVMDVPLSTLALSVGPSQRRGIRRPRPQRR